MIDKTSRKLLCSFITALSLPSRISMSTKQASAFQKIPTLRIFLCLSFTETFSCRILLFYTYRIRMPLQRSTNTFSELSIATVMSYAVPSVPLTTISAHLPSPSHPLQVLTNRAAVPTYLYTYKHQSIPSPERYYLLVPYLSTSDQVTNKSLADLLSRG